MIRSTLPIGSSCFAAKSFQALASVFAHGQLPGSCWCVPLYGEPKPWGWRWWTKWIANIERAHGEGAEMEVYFSKAWMVKVKFGGSRRPVKSIWGEKLFKTRSRTSFSRDHFWRLFLSVFAGGTASLFGVASRGRTPLPGGIRRSWEFAEGRSSMVWTEGLCLHWSGSRHFKVAPVDVSVMNVSAWEF